MKGEGRQMGRSAGLLVALGLVLAAAGCAPGAERAPEGVAAGGRAAGWRHSHATLFLAGQAPEEDVFRFSGL